MTPADEIAQRSGRVPGQWVAQQLAELLATVSRSTDEDAAARDGIERVAEVVEADVAALVRCGTVLASLGWPRIEVPERALVAAVGARGGAVPVPGAGGAPAFVVDLEDQDTWLVLARGGGEPFADDERALVRAAARALGLTMRLLRTIDAERGLRGRGELQARENARLLETSRKRARVLEATARIQRAISQRRPLTDVLQAIVAAAGDLLGGAAPALLLADEDDPHALRLAAADGLDAALVARGHVGEGAAGRAVAENRLVVLNEVASAVMAAPVHEDGRVVGALTVSSLATGRTFPPGDQELLRSFAEQASLALTDARRAGALQHQALHDALTGLPNRALFTDRLQHALAQGRRRGTACGVLVLDLDRFHTINESAGHAAGDELLLAVAQRVDGVLRSADTAARLGGDEFAILLEDLGGAEEAEAVAERLAEALRAPLTVGGREIFPAASMGIAADSAHDAVDLLRHADVALARAKAEGRGRAVVFDAGMDHAAGERLALEADLQRAIERDELVVFYQPIVALDGATLSGFEALVRWRHPERGLVPPGDFIPLAEETGLIVDVGRHVLRAACRQATAWDAAFPAPSPRLMSVNLSGRQLEDPRLVDDVVGALADSGLPASSLVLEITETVLMRDTDATIRRLEALRALGVRLAVDDFGTGYSSLTYLRGFPVDVLKVAKPFVDGVGVDDEGTALARAIVDIAASLGLRCVAEGIEEPRQAALLHDLGCGLGQGFHFARPMPADELTALIADPGAGVRFAVPS